MVKSRTTDKEHSRWESNSGQAVLYAGELNHGVIGASLNLLKMNKYSNG